MNDTQETPRGWARATVADIAEVVQYGSSAKTSEASAGVPVLRMGNIVGGRLDLSDLKYLPKDHHEFPELLLIPGDMLFNRTNSAELVGKTAVYEGLPRECSFASYLLRVRLTNYEPTLLSAYINSPAGREWIDSVVNQQVGQANVNGSKLRELEVPVPPVPEQHRIVAKLEALTEKSRRAKEALDAIAPLLERFRQSVLASAFRGDLTAEWRAKNPDVESAAKLLQRIRTERRRRWEESELAKMQAKGKPPADDRWKQKYEEPEPVDTEGLPELPEGWCWATLHQIAAIKGGLAKGSKRGPEDIVQDVHYLRVANVQRGFLNLEEVSVIDATEEEIRQLLLLPGDVLFNEGGDRDKLGRGWVWSGELPRCIHQNHVFRARPSLPELNSKIISWYGNTHGQSYFAGEGKQTTNLASISMSKLCKFPVPLIPAAEQEEIARLVSAYLVAIERVRHEFLNANGNLEGLNRSILAKAFRGDLVPQDPSDEPASVLLDRIRQERASASAAGGKKDKKAPTRR
jgi:type I restriction enzyme S subunit